MMNEERKEKQKCNVCTEWHDMLCCDAINMRAHPETYLYVISMSFRLLIKPHTNDNNNNKKKRIKSHPVRTLHIIFFALFISLRWLYVLKGSVFIFLRFFSVVVAVVCYSWNVNTVLLNENVVVTSRRYAVVLL